EPDERIGAAAAEQRVGAARAGAGQPGADNVERLDLGRDDIAHRCNHGVDAAVRGLGHDVAAAVDVVEVVAAGPDERIGSAAPEQGAGAARAGAGHPGADHVECLDVGGQGVVGPGDHDVVTGAGGLVHCVAGVADEVEVVADAAAQVVDAGGADQGVV